MQSIGLAVLSISIVLLLGPAACQGDAEAGFCPALDTAPGCSGERLLCEDYVAAEQNEHPVCISRQEALLACLEPLSLSCESGPDFKVYANGDGYTQDDDNTYLGKYLLAIRDEACHEAGEEYQRCKLCGNNVGFGIDKGGIGDPCVSTSECADTLRCENGGCTRDCEDRYDCLPKHGSEDECTTINGRILLCETGVCTTYCKGVAYEVNPCPPA